MKNFLLSTILGLLGAVPAWSQSTTPDTTSTPTAATQGNGSGLLQQLNAMTPTERQQFIANHPGLRQRIRAAMLKRYEAMSPAEQAQFAQKHPKIAQRLANASEAGAATKDPGHPRVNEVNGREGNQQQRITQGVDSGSLTAGQDSRLERREQRIQNQEASDLAKNDGHLTAGEKFHLNREENRDSTRIYDDKHDGN